MGLGAAALYVGTRGAGLRWRIPGALLLTLAICSMHFTAMSAAGLENCFSIVTPEEAATPVWLSLIVALTSVGILLTALAAAYLDLREGRRDALEADRMRSLADAAVEGLLVCRDGAIVTANASFVRLVGCAAERLEGRPLAGFLSPALVAALDGRLSSAIEGELSTASGAILPVEVDPAGGRVSPAHRIWRSRSATCRRASRPSSISAFSRITTR